MRGPKPTPTGPEVGTEQPRSSPDQPRRAAEAIPLGRPLVSTCPMLTTFGVATIAILLTRYTVWAAVTAA